MISEEGKTRKSLQIFSFFPCCKNKSNSFMKTSCLSLLNPMNSDVSTLPNTGLKWSLDVNLEFSVGAKHQNV